MRHLRTRHLGATSKATALAFAILATGTAYGVDTASATTPSTAASVGTQSGQAGLGDLRATSSEAEARRQLRALEATIQGRIGAYVIDTATGKSIGYRANERFPLLSTFKAMACAAVQHKARTSDPGLMDRVVHWTQAEVKDNSPVTEKHVEDGLTVAQLCEAAITRSDNTAGNMVLKQIGGPKGLTRYFRALKDPVSRLDRWETELNEWSPKEKRDTTTPAWMARDLRKVTLGSALTAEDRTRLEGWLRANQTGSERIRAGLPKSWTIGDKTGSSGSYGAANDIAVIRTSATAAPLIMAIYTDHKAADAAYDSKVIADTATILARGLGKLP
ncbi:class A beta-lactamase [Sphaerisporangium perillae]|uniref:class A beta-lactamase n=1 Tax=Sphaerisporangium perillae TaxID=2935860 RepID=UPI00200F8E57|nr:class A beta-lactamase [Sphaerisporangium perillae]